MRRPLAIIDVGSSAVKLGVYDPGPPPGLLHEADPVATGLGLGHVTGRPLAGAARAATLEAVTEFRRIADSLDARIHAVLATEAVRRASDREEFLDDLTRAAGTPAHCISAEDEARLGWRSARAALHDLGAAIITADPGGSSNDFACGTDDVERTLSLPFGMNDLVRVRPVEREEGRVDPAGRAALSDYLTAAYSPLNGLRGCGDLVASSGALIAAAAVRAGVTAPDRHERAVRTHGTTVTRAEFERLIDVTAPMTTAERRVSHPCLSPARAAIFVHGCLAYVAMLDALALDCVRVNALGIKFGAVLALPAPAGKPEEL